MDWKNQHLCCDCENSSYPVIPTAKYSMSNLLPNLIFLRKSEGRKTRITYDMNIQGCWRPLFLLCFCPRAFLWKLTFSLSFSNLSYSKFWVIWKQSNYCKKLSDDNQPSWSTNATLFPGFLSVYPFCPALSGLFFIAYPSSWAISLGITFYPVPLPAYEDKEHVFYFSPSLFVTRLPLTTAILFQVNIFPSLTWILTLTNFLCLQECLHLLQMSSISHRQPLPLHRRCVCWWILIPLC